MKNSKYFLLAMLGLMSVPALAQETYQNTKMAENSLTGTARYVGMGGAMEALGADISTMSSNPAGIGLFRKSQVSMTFGVVAQTDAETALNYNGSTLSFDGKKSKPSFDQAGFVWSPSSKGSNYINLGFNYHKSTNFNQILTAVGRLDGASQNRLTAAKYAKIRKEVNDYAESHPYASSKDLQDYSNYLGDMIATGVDYGYQNMFGTNADGSMMNSLKGEDFLFGQYQHGYIGVYDFNISGSLNNRVWLGLTVGLHDVHYNSNSSYGEILEQVGTASDGSSVNAATNSMEQVKITGTGFDVKFGAIFRPFVDSPFRIGVYVNSPAFYELTRSSAIDMEAYNLPKSFAPSESQPGISGNLYDSDYHNISDYDFRLNTPWKVGASLGHTIGSNIALGATYEYAWYNHMDTRIKDGGYYDYYWGEYYESSTSDKVMNENTKSSLKGVSTLKIGIEYKPIQMLALRLGYNYVSPMFNKYGVRDQFLICDADANGNNGVNTSASSDYTNWKATNRFTVGAGFNYKNLFIDVAYQYSSQNGDFYPYKSYYPKDNSELGANIAPVTEVNNKRHQLLMTVGYRF